MLIRRLPRRLRPVTLDPPQRLDGDYQGFRALLYAQLLAFNCVYYAPHRFNQDLRV